MPAAWPPTTATPIAAFALRDGDQSAEQIAGWLVDWIGGAQRSLDIALYDVRLPGEVGDRVAGALKAAAARGVAVRIAYNHDENDVGQLPSTPPPRTQPPILEAIGVPLRAIPGEPDLMHHKYLVRDGESVWTGSTNWTLDSWTREENVLVAVNSAAVAADFAHDFTDLWDGGKVEKSGRFDTVATAVGDATVRAWFCPGRGEELSDRIAAAITAATRRVRIASPVLTAAAVLHALDGVLAAGTLDVTGVCDATQIHQVFNQWHENPNVSWKVPVLAGVLTRAQFHGKQSTPYAPGAVHDYMHAKVTVVDDTVFLGSFNLSRSGEQNAENVLEIADPVLADAMAAFIDETRGRYPVVEPPAFAAASAQAGPSGHP